MPLQMQGSDKMKLEVHSSVGAWLKVKNSYKLQREVHSSATTGARQCQKTVIGKHSYKIKREMHTSDTEVQEGDKTKQEVHNSAS